MKLAFVSLTTTGLEQSKNSIIGIDILILNTNTKSIRSFKSLSRPWRGRYIDSKSLKINKVTVEEIMTYPSEKTGFFNLVEFLKDHINSDKSEDKLIIVAYNSDFIKDFLGEWFSYRHNEELNFGDFFNSHTVDLYRISKLILLPHLHRIPYNFHFSLANVCKILNIPDNLNGSNKLLEIFKKIYENKIIDFTLEGII